MTPLATKHCGTCHGLMRQRRTQSLESFRSQDYCDDHCKRRSQVARDTRSAESRRGSDWRHDAACRDANVDPDWFFPVPRSGAQWEREVRRAKEVCGVCPVKAACLEYALDCLPAGIAGGMTEQERESIRRPRAIGRAIDRWVAAES